MKKIIVLILCLVMCLSFSGCDKLSNLQAGFKLDNDVLPVYFCAYKSEKTVFKLDETSFSFSYGASALAEITAGKDIIHRLVFSNKSLGLTGNYEQAILVKEISDFTLEDYGIKLMYDNQNKTTLIEFAHSEILTIPSELMNNAKGVIYFSILRFATYISDDKEEYEGGGEIAVYYKKSGEKVSLFDSENKRE